MAERSARRRRLPTNVKADIFAKQILDDFEDEVEAQLNGFIAAVVSDLTSPKVSPVLTGFFASSWKAGSTMPNEADRRQGYSPWSSIQVNGNRLAPGQKAYIKQRHAVPKTFKLNSTIYIGNTAKYTPQALLSPKSKVFPYLAGGAGAFTEGLDAKIDKFFRDKRPNITVGGDTTTQVLSTAQTQYQDL